MVKLGIEAACALLFVAGPAMAAVNIANQDSKTHTVVINRGSQGESSKDVAAGQSLQVDCPDKCGFRLASSGFSRVAGGDAKLVIDKDAELHFVGGKGDLTMPNGTN